MKKITQIPIFTFFTIILFLACNTNNMKNNNPLLETSQLPYGAPQFDKIKVEHYKPAFEAAIKEGRATIAKIADCTDEASFSNTIEKLEFAGEKLSSIGAIFFNLNEAHTDDAMQSIALEVSPMLTEYSNEIMLNEKLFERVKSLYDNKDNLSLNHEQMRLLDETYKGFARNGANLKGEEREKFKNINVELSQLSLKFGQNVLAATNKFILHITDTAQLEGLPPFVQNSAAAEAKERELEGWVFTLNAPSFIPFLKYSKNRELREKIWKAYYGKSYKDEFDNSDIIKKIVELRLQKANLLGYNTHAHYVLEKNMAKEPVIVENFLNDLLGKTLPYARKEIAQIKEYAKNKGFNEELMPWDFTYWSEKYKSEKYAINDQLLKPYFKLESVEEAVFALADSLYGLKFIQNKTIPVYHKDVKVFEVHDNDGKFLSLLYVDYFPRESKRGGAWMTSFREQSIKDGVERRPFVSLVCNFTKPTETSPSLLTFGEFVTLLHEFGHALHGMLAQGSYSSLTGTNVVRDFVELPSQIMENWATESDYLKSFAKHYETGEPIPQELIDKIVAARNFLSGYNNVRQIAFGINDMAWHTLTNTENIGDIGDFERKAIKRTQIMPDCESTSLSSSFSHIFSGGYSAGYYSYKWAEVLEADAFSLFKEKGIFNKEVAGLFRDNILSKGNLEDASQLYKNFRGREPRADALLEKFGMTYK